MGFALTFGGLLLFLLVYSFSQPSLWLPVAFGMAFSGLLAFAPRIPSLARVGLAMVFTCGSCGLWMVSGSASFQASYEGLQLAFQIVLGTIGLIGALVAIAGWRRAPAKSAPGFGPIFVLMLLGWLISYFSSTHGGASPMVAWVIRTFGWNAQTAETVIIAARKTTHVCFYGFVAAVALAAMVKNGVPRQSGWIAALIITLTYASFDEIRQSTQPDRTGSAWDVLLDLSGGSMSLLALSAVARSKKAGSPKPARKSSTL